MTSKVGSWGQWSGSWTSHQEISSTVTWVRKLRTHFHVHSICHNLAKVSARTHCRFENSCGIYYAPTNFSNSFHSQVTAVYVSQELMGKILDISKIGHRYRPQAYLRKSNVFTSVCQEYSVGGGGEGVSQHALGGVGCVSQHALGWGCVSQHAICKGVWQTPPGQTPSRQTPPPRTATAADGTHPTGMHSCYFLWLGCCCSYIIDLESRVPKLVCCHEFMANTMNGWFGLVMFQFSRAFPHSDHKWDSPHAFMWFRGFHYNKSSLKINEWTSLYLQVSLG